MSLFFLETGAAQVTAPNIYAGNIAALASGIFFGLYFIFLRHPRSKHGNPAVSVFYGNIIVVLVMLPLVLNDPPASVTFGDAAAILYLGIFQIGVAYIFFTNGIAGGVRSMDASIIGFIEPMFNPLWVFVILGETPGRWALVGGMIILSSVGLHTFRQYKKRPAESAA
jgi:drug/metabolite transporter (DMT)-like permease